MNTLFFSFTMALLVLIELECGTLGIYLPLTEAGAFYFGGRDFSRGAMVGVFLSGCAVDAVLSREWLFSGLLCAAVFYVSGRMSECRAEGFGALRLPGLVLGATAVMVQYLPFCRSAGAWADWAAHAIFGAFTMGILLPLLAVGLDALARALHLKTYENRDASESAGRGLFHP